MSTPTCDPSGMTYAELATHLERVPSSNRELFAEFGREYLVWLRGNTEAIRAEVRRRHQRSTLTQRAVVDRRRPEGVIEDGATVLELRAQGKTLQEIGDQVRTTRECVRKKQAAALTDSRSYLLFVLRGLDFRSIGVDIPPAEPTPLSYRHAASF